ncbi:MAG: MBOAT family protein [Desulfobacterales bacterium]|nr:MBOAT family protein [Desulfobacterales bacterium]
MLFNSFAFLFFFPCIVFFYYGMKHRFRWIFLLITSYAFYMYWKPYGFFLIAIPTLVSYLASLAIERSSHASKKKILILSIIINLGLLCSWKYANTMNLFFLYIFSQLHLPYRFANLNIVLPIGISFYTFQTLSYIIDVYKQKLKAERHLGMVSLYVAFFPQLLSGPIGRAPNLLPQFSKYHHFDYDHVVYGLRRMAWGFFKKLIIADRLAIYVNGVYQNPYDFYGFHLIIATYFYAFQIYCDFSGYSDIAIGAARVMGFNLMENFSIPYRSQSIAEFWRRWHISLSTWFRDYLYIPLGGNRVTAFRRQLNLMIVFLVTGAWHGATSNFVIWGGLHGVYYLCSIWTKSIRETCIDLFQLGQFPKLHQFINMLFTFHIVWFAWIFFRANTLADAFWIVCHLFDFKPTTDIQAGLTSTGFSLNIILIVVLISVETIQYQCITLINYINNHAPLRWALYYILLMSLTLLGTFSQPQAFVYFQF